MDMNDYSSNSAVSDVIDPQTPPSSSTNSVTSLSEHARFKSGKKTNNFEPNEHILPLSSDPVAEYRECEVYYNKALKFARQEQWEEISEALRVADKSMLKTPGGMPVTDLIGQGARADIVDAYEHILIDGTSPENSPAFTMVRALENILNDNPNDYAIAAIVAHAHMDMGWAWHGTSWKSEPTPTQHKAFTAHFKRAGDILAPFKNQSPRTPYLAGAIAAQYAGNPIKKAYISSAYERLVLHDPQNTRALRLMGLYMLPRWYGDYFKLERQACWAETQGHNPWGSGAYTWVQMDAIVEDSNACSRLDIAKFIDGIKEILKIKPNQQMINFWAAYCSITMARSKQIHPLSKRNQEKIKECADWIIKDHLKELEPIQWAQASKGYYSKQRIRSLDRIVHAGTSEAMHVIHTLFAADNADADAILSTQ